MLKIRKRGFRATFPQGSDLPATNVIFARYTSCKKLLAKVDNHPKSDPLAKENITFPPR